MSFRTAVLALSLLCGLAPIGQAQSPGETTRDAGRTTRPERDPYPGTLYQVSTLDALLQGIYQGAVPIGDLRRWGDFGLGTLDSLDGEMIILDGNFYQVTADGIVHLPPESARVPFAALTRFSPEITLMIRAPATMEEIDSLIGNLGASANYFYAIRVEGTFRTMTARSVPRQFPPFPPLANVIAQQSIFPLVDIEGTAVCLVTPAFATGINVAGLHCHFISADASRGGHALDFTLESGTFQMQTLRQHTTLLPEGEEFQQVPLPLNQNLNQN